MRLSILKNEDTVKEFEALRLKISTPRKAITFFDIKKKPEDISIYYIEKRQLKDEIRTSYKLKREYYEILPNAPRRWSPTTGTRINGWSIDFFYLAELAYLVFYFLSVDKIALSDAAKISGVSIQTIKKRRIVLETACDEIKKANSQKRRSLTYLTKQTISLLFSPQPKKITVVRPQQKGGLTVLPAGK